MGQWSKSFPYDVSSRQSPSVLNTWPLTPSPTGTEIDAPVSTTSAPRTRPSVGCIEMQRTRLSPRCRATSRVNVLASSENVMSVWSALNNAGTAPRGNSTSTTGPVTRTTRPLVSLPALVVSRSAVAVMSSSLLWILLGAGQRVRATDDFADFLGDLSLAFPVGLQSQIRDEVVGVVACRLHCASAGRRLRRRGLEQRREYPGGDIPWQQRLEQGCRVRLEGEQRVRSGGFPHLLDPRMEAGE